MGILDVEFLGIAEEEVDISFIRKVVQACFEKEQLLDKNLSMNVLLTTPEQIQEYNKQYRNIDKTTDVLSFPMFEKTEIDTIVKKGNNIKDVLGDVVISVKQVRKQAIEYGHSFDRELAYMLVHGFYHLMGYDHIKEEDKAKMRPKEEAVLQQLNINRE